MKPANQNNMVKASSTSVAIRGTALGNFNGPRVRRTTMGIVHIAQKMRKLTSEMEP